MALAASIQKALQCIDNSPGFTDQEKFGCKEMLLATPVEDIGDYITIFLFPEEDVAALIKEIEIAHKDGLIESILAEERAKIKPERNTSAQGAPLRGEAREASSLTAQTRSSYIEQSPHQLEDVLERLTVRAEAGLQVSEEQAEAVIQLLKQKSSRG